MKCYRAIVAKEPATEAIEEMFLVLFFICYTAKQAENKHIGTLLRYSWDVHLDV